MCQNHFYPIMVSLDIEFRVYVCIALITNLVVKYVINV